ncbi:MAG: hypothetical protein HY866_09520 [Chloroflexi bacterium]|nr:hypothetical protein [Chloroflexota bacterium]
MGSTQKALAAAHSRCKETCTTHTPFSWLPVAGDDGMREKLSACVVD